jgi:ketosteroid isomerase-like protein
MELDEAFSKASKQGGLQSSYSRFLLPASRMNLNDSKPLVGKEAIVSHAAALNRRVELHPLGAALSNHGDLGYTYGTFTTRNLGAPVTLTRGHYVRVWKRDTDGDWKIVAENLNTEMMKSL